MEIKEQLVTFFQDNFMIDLPENFSDDDSLMNNGIVDSTGILELVTFLEETYNFKIANDDIVPENLDSINRLRNYIQSKTN